MNELDLAWAAGFFDGEGCILIRKSSKNAHAIRITISQVNPSPIKKFKDLFGGHISYQRPKNQKWSSQWKWEQDSKSASETLKNLLPYLLVKQDVAALALEFQSFKKDKGYKLTPVDFKRELKFKSKISQLNRKD